MTNSFAQVRRRMNQTGVGLAGLDGVWWLPATQPLSLPNLLNHQLKRIAEAAFALFDAVTISYQTDDATRNLLQYRVPGEILAFRQPAPVLGVRPDFQLIPHAAGESAWSLVATELEICPSAHGVAHAMQVGYSLEPDLVNAYAHMLKGRELLFVSTANWSEFLWEQLAFCAALAQVGARARVLLSHPIEALAQDVAAQRTWQPPMFGIPQQPTHWRSDVLGRIREHNFEAYLQHTWPTAQDLQHSVIFRFGYFDCFEPAVLHQLADWQRHGVTFINPNLFIWDSKVVMAALHLPEVRQRLDAPTLATLDACIPETQLLTPELVPQLVHERQNWIVKFAGFDRGQQAWGGRSLQIGAQHNSSTWLETLQRYVGLPFPCVAQRTMPSAKLDVAYWDEAGHEQWLRGGRSRLRSFFLRSDEQDLVQAIGTHITVAGAGLQVSESVEAVQATVIFRD